MELTDKDRARFIKFFTESPNSCWEWQGYRRPAGYGQFSVRGEHINAQRVAYAIAYGPFDRSLHVLHKCDNPPCVNPAHLFLGTDWDNIHDCIAKGRKKVQRGPDHPGYRITEAVKAEIFERLKTGISQRALGRQMGLSHTSIRWVAIGRR